MIKGFSKFATIALAVSSMLFVCSCGSYENSILNTYDKAENGDNNAYEYVYEFNDISFNMSSNSEYTCVESNKDGIYGLKKTSSEGHTNYSFLSLKNDDTKPKETFIGSGNYDFEKVIMGSDGCFYVIRTFYPEKSAVQETGSDNSLSKTGTRRLVKYSSSGDELWKTFLLDSDKNANSRNIAYLKNKGILIYTKTGFSFYDENTGKGKFLEIEDKGNVHNDRILITGQDGKVFVFETDSEWNYVIYEFDVKKMTLKNKKDAPDGVYTSSYLFTGISYDFYYVDNECVYGFNFGDKSVDKICSFIDSGFYIDNTVMFNEISPGNFRIIASYNEDTGKIYSMTKKEKNTDDKTVITIGTAFTDENIKKRIIDFNQNNDKYMIKVKEYSEGGYSSYYSVYKSMNEDIESGNAPDILVLSSYSSIDSYISRGFLEPLDSYLKKDTEIQKNDYLDNITELQKRNGKTYMIIPFFSVDTCAVSKNHLDGTSVSLQNYRNLCNKHNIKIQYMLGDVHFEGIDDFYTTSGFDFIDFENNTCDFENYKFVNLLIYLREIKKLEDNKGPRIGQDSYRNENALLLPYFITSFEDYKIIKDGYFGEDIVFNGYPSIDGGSSYINPWMMFAISSSSKNKEIAWEFIRYFLLDEYQYSIDWGFPVNEKALDIMMDASCHEKYYIDENGHKIITKSKTTIGDRIYSIKSLNKKEATELKSFIIKINKLRHQDTELIGIISEVANHFYNEEITAERASTLIQHRVEEYLRKE
ncbi:ABC transporter substrate-binding protein [Butyrivibrio sp. WCE2006]|uniref:ABC transporter substrate-binding protein n=1 Tax=Butyrivibrio sp. WCE2006 TaxID=1410611 RepID=UPI0005D2024C|nr:ABC transporter substrate-binding protein [Butyrivibrio sp. WCE2006]